MTREEVEILYAWVDILTPEECRVLLAYLTEAIASGRLQDTAMIKLTWDGGEGYQLRLPHPTTGAYVSIKELGA